MFINCFGQSVIMGLNGSVISTYSIMCADFPVTVSGSKTETVKSCGLHDGSIMYAVLLHATFKKDRGV